MKMERPASLSMNDAGQTAAASNRVRPSVRHPFMPISEYEARMFDALHAKETLAEAAEATGRKPRLPRFSLLRGEVAQLAERVLHITRGAA